MVYINFSIDTQATNSETGLLRQDLFPVSSGERSFQLERGVRHVVLSGAALVVYLGGEPARVPAGLCDPLRRGSAAGEK